MGSADPGSAGELSVALPSLFQIRRNFFRRIFHIELA
jgi:hypothetical protein